MGRAGKTSSLGYGGAALIGYGCASFAVTQSGWHGARRRRYTCTVAMRLGGRRAFPEDCPDVVSENRREGEGEGECTACGDGALAHMDL
ncbi:hypothetical protein M758_5G044800 [Ceratodon purpureus]|uniref:Uncharacterized protein n=1 Tax=Ceratodon purpureus TaxID=3225 RepID=A0A8T0HXW3_CERPU|nr:hypothetical protein KC19_5G045700 [Ceratodon purpureus]KAG0615483.1 hypothetical protein M758_5G044800 [Ceratodon purpureus]